MFNNVIYIPEVLSPAEIDKIHQSSMRILRSTGVVFHSDEACNLFKQHGARVEGKKVFIPENLVEKAISTCPLHFTVKSRNPLNNVTIGAGLPALEATRGSIYIADSSGNRRKALSEDFIALTKLVQTSPVINLNCGGVTLPSDISQSALPAFSMIISALYTDKPLPGLTLNEKIASECLQLAEIAYGGLEENLVLGTICPISPLIYDAGDLKVAFAYARADQPLCVTSCSMAGTTSPPTLAGTLIVNNAETLAGITLIQLIKEATPVVYGNLSSIADMRYINMATGAPEGALLQVGACQLARFYKLPFRGGGSLNDAKGVDIQAGGESMMNLMLNLLSGFDYIPHAIGVVDSFMSIAFEKFIIDEDMVMALKRLARGIEVNDATLLTDLIEQVGPGGNYLTANETASLFRREFWQPSIDLRQPQSLWQSSGALDAPARAMNVCRRRLESYIKPDIPLSVERELLNYFKNHYGQAQFLQPA